MRHTRLDLEHAYWRGLILLHLLQLWEVICTLMTEHLLGSSYSKHSSNFDIDQLLLACFFKGRNSLRQQCMLYLVNHIYEKMICCAQVMCVSYNYITNLRDYHIPYDSQWKGILEKKADLHCTWACQRPHPYLQSPPAIPQLSRASVEFWLPTPYYAMSVCLTEYKCVQCIRMVKISIINKKILIWLFIVLCNLLSLTTAEDHKKLVLHEPHIEIFVLFIDKIV